MSQQATLVLSAYLTGSVWAAISIWSARPVNVSRGAHAIVCATVTVIWPIAVGVALWRRLRRA